MTFENNFVARTRVRGEIDYFLARWKEKPGHPGEFVVKFVDGPHKGEEYEARNVAKAQEWRK